MFESSYPLSGSIQEVVSHLHGLRKHAFLPYPIKASIPSREIRKRFRTISWLIPSMDRRVGSPKMPLNGGLERGPRYGAKTESICRLFGITALRPGMSGGCVRYRRFRYRTRG